MHWSGIRPRFPTWQALNHQNVHTQHWQRQETNTSTKRRSRRQCLVSFFCVIPNRDLLTCVNYVWSGNSADVSFSTRPNCSTSLNGNCITIVPRMHTTLTQCRLLHTYLLLLWKLLAFPSYFRMSLPAPALTSRQLIRINFKSHLSWGYSTRGLDQSMRGNNQWWTSANSLLQYLT